jgi:hypothetical protein
MIDEGSLGSQLTFVIATVSVEPAARPLASWPALSGPEGVMACRLQLDEQTILDLLEFLFAHALDVE